MTNDDDVEIPRDITLRRVRVLSTMLTYPSVMEVTDMTAKTYEYEAIIQKVPDLDGAYLPFPYDLRKEFGKGRVKVHATFDGEPYQGSIVNMGIKNPDGSICYIIGIRKDIRSKINKQPGDVVHVRIKERD